MKVLEIEHIDFTLTVSCRQFYGAYKKARSRQANLNTATSYVFGDCELISILNPQTRELQPLLEKELWPIFYENAEYFIDIHFKNADKEYHPVILTKLKEIEDKFIYRPALKLLAGTVNFGNNIGKFDLEFEYKKEGVLSKYNLCFEVFPTKLDYRSDYLKIIQDIEEEYPNLVLSFLKKTYSNYSTKRGGSSDVVWWQIFGGLYEELLQASKFILNKPHARLVKNIRYVKADKIKRFTPQLEEKFHEFKRIPNKIYRTEIKNLSLDTVENQFFKHALNQVTRKFIKLKSYIIDKYSREITKGFKKELKEIESQLKSANSNPLFRKVGHFKGFRQESLLIQKGLGYSTIYKNWIMLNSGISFLEGIQKLEEKNIAELYEIWCFLEVKNIIQELLGVDKPEEIELAQIEIDSFIFKFERGIKSRVLYKKENGDTIEIFHDYQIGKTEIDNLKSFTIDQRPDIMVKLTKNDLRDKFKFTYLYDAKYRLDADYTEEGSDEPPNDAINQMHRYRDAIYYINKEKGQKEKEVIGGYILFPGSGSLENIKSNNYYQSIEKVNIGAFPLKPKDSINKQLLINHFKEILELDSSNILNESIPQKGLNYEEADGQVLVGFTSTELQKQMFLEVNEPFYHIPVSKINLKNLNKIQYFAPYLNNVSMYFEVTDISIQNRCDIKTSKYIQKKNSTEPYYVLKLNKKTLLSTPVAFSPGNTVIRYGILSLLRKAKNLKSIKQ